MRYRKYESALFLWIKVTGSIISSNIQWKDGNARFFLNSAIFLRKKLSFRQKLKISISLQPDRVNL